MINSKEFNALIKVIYEEKDRFSRLLLEFSRLEDRVKELEKIKKTVFLKRRKNIDEYTK